MSTGNVMCDVTTIKIQSATPGWNLEAWRFLPTRSRDPVDFDQWVEYTNKPPAIVMANGFGATKEMSLSVYAEAFVSRGYAVVLFDYRRWGGSDGQPRNILNVKEQLDDYRTVIEYVRRSPNIFDVSRVVLFGTSFSGGHITYLASEDDNIAAALGQSPFEDGVSSISILAALRLLPRSLLHLFRKKPVYIPITAAKSGGLALLTGRGIHEGYLSVARGATFENKIQASAIFQILTYRPCHSAKHIKCPLFLAIPSTDNVCPPSGALKAIKDAQNGECFRFGGGHFDCYPGFASYKMTSDAMLEFIERLVPI